MKLATLRDGSRDGTLVVVSRDLQTQASAASIAPTLQAALDDWDEVAPKLEALAARLSDGREEGAPFEPEKALSPLPRAYEWIDGSAYLNHVRLVRKARNAEPPKTLETDPLVYQGGSGCFLAPTEPIPLPDPAWGLDFESEVVVVLGDVPQGTTAAAAAPFVRLVGICNDITFRSLIPTELAKGFGFFNGKPATAFAPVFCTPDELGDAWREGRLHLPLETKLNDTVVGTPEAGPEMHFSFFDLIAHIAKTRAFTAGTILGSGTVSNEGDKRGISCLAERRMIEIIAHGEPRTGWMKAGDRVRIEMRNGAGASIFGAIDQVVAGKA
ncbi:MAG: fumarylacetoacetate hydrolase family protein [Myxococcota bacterium]